MKLLTSTESLDDLVSKNQHTLLFFSASWCGPCQSMTPVVESVSNLMGERINTIKIDVDTFQNDAADYGIRSVPTLMIVKDDEIIAQQVGGIPPHQLIQLLEQHV